MQCIDPPVDTQNKCYSDIYETVSRDKITVKLCCIIQIIWGNNVIWMAGFIYILYNFHFDKLQYSFRLLIQFKQVKPYSYTMLLK